MRYRITTFKTLTGKIEFVDLGDHVNGEWIIYENNIPKFHVSCFRENSKSDALIHELLKSKDWTIEKIIDQINTLNATKLTLGKRPLVEIEESSELREIELKSLPLEWIEQIKAPNNG